MTRARQSNLSVAPINVDNKISTDIVRACRNRLHVAVSLGTETRPRGLGRLNLRTIGLRISGPIKMADIARLANVSMSTVSRALANSPLIPEEKRLEIQEIANKAGYVVNQSARSLRMRKTETITIVFPLGHEVGQLISDPFFMEMFARLADEITLRNYQVLLCRVTSTAEGWLDKIVQGQRQDGIILIGQSDQEQAIQRVAALYKPMVVWGGDFPDQVYCTVGTDNIAGGRRAVEHLIGLGRKNIAFFGVPELPEIGLRQIGYLQALAAAGLHADPKLTIPTQFSYEAAYDAALSFVKSGATFDAIFASSDVIALAACAAVTEAGLRVPHDVSVIGFDDIARASLASPPLTTIRQDLGSGARHMVDLLFKRIAGDDTASIVLEPDLIIRKSCGALI